MYDRLTDGQKKAYTSKIFSWQKIILHSNVVSWPRWSLAKVADETKEDIIYQHNAQGYQEYQ